MPSDSLILAAVDAICSDPRRHAEIIQMLCGKDIDVEEKEALRHLGRLVDAANLRPDLTFRDALLDVACAVEESAPSAALRISSCVQLALS